MAVSARSFSEDPTSFEQALGESLIEKGKLDAAGFERAKRVRSDTGDRLSVILPKLGLVSERDLAEALAAQLELPLVGPREFPEEPLFKDRLSPRFLREAQVLPIAEEAEGLVVAMADPLNRFALDALRLVAGGKVQTRVGVPGQQ